MISGYAALRAILMRSLRLDSVAKAQHEPQSAGTRQVRSALRDAEVWTPKQCATSETNIEEGAGCARASGN